MVRRGVWIRRRRVDRIRTRLARLLNEKFARLLSGLIPRRGLQVDFFDLLHITEHGLEGHSHPQRLGVRDRPLEMPDRATWQRAFLDAFLAELGLADNDEITAFRAEVAMWPDEVLQRYLTTQIAAAQSSDKLQRARYAIAWQSGEARGLTEQL